MTAVGRVLATRRPLRRDAERFANLLRGPFGHGEHAEIAVDLARLLDRALAAAGAGRGALDDGVDERAAHRLVGDRVLRDVELEQRHRALDVHPDRAGIDMGRRDHHAADRRAVSGVSVGIEYHIGDTRSHARVDGLLEAGFVEAIADGVGSDHGDGFSRIVGKWDEAGGFAGFMDGFHDCW